MNRAKSDVTPVRFLSCGMDYGVLVVDVYLELNLEQHDQKEEKYCKRRLEETIEAITEF